MATSLRFTSSLCTLLNGASKTVCADSVAVNLITPALLTQLSTPQAPPCINASARAPLAAPVEYDTAKLWTVSSAGGNGASERLSCQYLLAITANGSIKITIRVMASPDSDSSLLSMEDESLKLPVIMSEPITNTTSITSRPI